VRSLFIVRRTRRNQRLLAELRPLFAARFPGSAAAWLRALGTDAAPLPATDGLLWSTSHYRIVASRLGGGNK
jgi:hypothetical protein